MLINPPEIRKDDVTATEVPLEWLPWNQRRGDTGDPPILWYSVWVKKIGEKDFRWVMLPTNIGLMIEKKCNSRWFWFSRINQPFNSKFIKYQSTKLSGFRCTAVEMHSLDWNLFAFAPGECSDEHNFSLKLFINLFDSKCKMYNRSIRLLVSAYSI